MSFHTYRVTELYSSADGLIQYIELKESQGLSGQSFWNGITIKSRTAVDASVPVTYTFLNDLPSTSTAGTTVLLATQGFANLGLVTPDFIIPNGFLLSGGGILNFGNVDQLQYPALPTDGFHSINRVNVASQWATGTGLSSAGTPTNFSGSSAILGLGGHIDGTAGADTITGTSGADEIFPGLGDDVVHAGGGNDVVFAHDASIGAAVNEGNDTIFGDSGDDYLSAYPGLGNHSMDGGLGKDSLFAGSGADTLLGGDDDDYLSSDGVSGNHSLDGGAGKDALYGGAGRDTLLGGSGADTLFGGNGSSVLDGGDDNDLVDARGRTGNNQLFGGAGADTLNGGNGNDSLYGDDGSDQLSTQGQSGNHWLDGGANADTLIGSAGQDTLTGGSGDDSLTGGAGNDVFLFAAQGNGVDQISDFASGDLLRITGGNFSGEVSTGTGSALGLGGVQLSTANGTSVLFIGTDAVAGADIEIHLDGTRLPGDFVLAGNQISFGAITANGKAVDFLAFSWKAHTLLDGVSIGGAGQNTSTGVAGSASFAAVADNVLPLSVARDAPAESAATAAAVNLQDAIAIMRLIVGLEANGVGKPLSPYQALAADFDNNGTVSLNDAIAVLRHVVGLSSPEPTWHFANEADLSVPGKAGLNPGAPPAITADLSASSPVHVGLVGYLSGDVDGSFGGAANAQDLDNTQPGYFVALVDSHPGLSLAQFGIYPV